jgi:hypothetical protein
MKVYVACKNAFDHLNFLGYVWLDCRGKILICVQEMGFPSPESIRCRLHLAQDRVTCSGDFMGAFTRAHEMTIPHLPLRAERDSLQCRSWFLRCKIESAGGHDVLTRCPSRSKARDRCRCFLLSCRKAQKYAISQPVGSRDPYQQP